MSGSDSSGESSESMASVRHPGPSKTKRKDPQTPQQKIDEFWTKYKSKAPGKATSVIPQNEFAERAAKRASAKSKAPPKTTQQSYEEAAEQCRRKVAQIVKECRRVNSKYRDPHFDLELDLKFGRRDCLDSLDNERNGNSRRRYVGRRRGRDSPLKDRGMKMGSAPPPKSGTIMGLLSAVDREATVTTGSDGDNMFRPTAVKRVVDIFDNPQFFVNGPTANDVRQGRDGDCWLMAALCTLSNKSGLIERCCIAHDVDVGVYGFVFHRDGEWFSEIIDDKLYLTKPDYDEALLERILWEDRERVNSEEAYRKIYQSNSGALYFAQCEDANETWLPLLEKAYAKAHGDYSAIEGGYGGEGIEDLTGGVTSEIYTTDILDKEHFWNEELMKVNQDFLFGCSTGVWGRGWGERKGIVELHAYSVLKAREIDGVRLVLLKNPWGKHEWQGAWSDGSKEWTAEWLQKLEHKFGDDGSFWISYEDLLTKYQAFDRTRLFGPEWKVASIWTTLNVSWTLDYHDTKFAFSLANSGPVVIVFSQLDERYFRGLEGQYRFELGFRVHKAGEEEYVVRSQNYYRMNRSVNVELDLEAGEYVVVVKIDAQRNERIMPVEEVVRAHAKERREKLLRVGFAYDVAHSKGKIIESDEEKTAREAYEKRKRDAERRKMADAIRKAKMASKWADWKEKMKKRKKTMEARAKAKARSERKAAKRKAKGKDAAEEMKEEGRDTADHAFMSQTENKGVDGHTDVDGKESKTNDKPVTTEDNKPEESQDDTSETKQASASENSTIENTAPLSPSSDEKRVKIEATNVTGNQAEDSFSSTEPGEATPESSTILENTLPLGDDLQAGDEDYVTAAEEGDTRTIIQPTEQQRAQNEGDESETPKKSQPPLKTAETRFTPGSVAASSTQPPVDVGVQTGPGLPLPTPSPSPQPPPPPALYRKHRSQYPFVASSHPVPPPGASYSYSRPTVRYLSQLPPHMRAAYVASYNNTNRIPSDTTSLSSTDSDSSEEPDMPSDVSEVSDDDIEAWIASAEATQVARAAAAAAATGKNGPSPPETTTEEDLLDEFERDPWNAVGVFGLRVYYKVIATDKKEEGEDGKGKEEEEQEVVKLRVERPNPYVWDDSEDGSGDEGDDAGAQADDEKEDGAEETKVLDIDDSSKDAVGENADVVGMVGEKKETVKEEEEGDSGKKGCEEKKGSEVQKKHLEKNEDKNKDNEKEDDGKFEANQKVVDGEDDAENSDGKGNATEKNSHYKMDDTKKDNGKDEAKDNIEKDGTETESKCFSEAQDTKPAGEPRANTVSTEEVSDKATDMKTEDSAGV